MIAWESAGSAGFKGSRKSTPFAAQVTADAAAQKGMEHGLERVEVFAKGAGSGRETAIRSLQAAGLEVTTVKDVTPQAHNGCRPKQAEAGLGMARDTGPQCKQCRREGQKLFLKGERCLTDKCGVERRSYPPGDHGRGRMRAVRVPPAAAREAEGAPLLPGAREAIPRLLRQGLPPGRRHRREPAAAARARFDNVLVRLGFAASRRQARQLIRHGHWQINGRRVDIPSLPGAARGHHLGQGRAPTPPTSIRVATELISTVPAWLQADHDSLTAKILRLPGAGRDRLRRCTSSSSSSCTRSSRGPVPEHRTTAKDAL